MNGKPKPSRRPQGEGTAVNKTGNAPQKTICVMIGDVSSEYSAELMKGFFDEAEREGMRLLLMMGMPRHAGHFGPETADSAAYHYNSIYDYASLSGADAYVFSCGALSGFESENKYQEFLKRFEGTPYVILQEQIDLTAANTACITVDNDTSFSQCVEHLIETHHCRKIAFVGGLKEHPDTRERLRAYQKTMAQHGLPVTDDMVVYGDYSEYSDLCVAQLLDNNPGLEAIAFCNDEMAKGGYRECHKRGLKIGKDIAVTGFDNFSTSRSLVPPLTTISQNTYQMGGLALKHLAALMRGETVSSTRLSTKLHIRRSCGCSPNTVCKLFQSGPEGNETELHELMQTLAADLVNAYTQSEREQAGPLVRRLTEHIERLCAGGPQQPFDRLEYADWLQAYCEEHSGATLILAKRINEYIMLMPDDCINRGFQRRLYDVLAFTQGFLFSYRARVSEQNLDVFRAQSWFIPELIRDLVGYDIENESVFSSVVERLHGIQIRSCYICLLPQARPLHDTGHLYMPTQLLLAAYQSDTGAKAFRFSRMPVIDTENSLRNLPELQGDRHMMCFSIFSGDTQYGVFLCEVDIARSALMHIIGLQLGILINFLELKQKEKIVGSELENIRERNEILNFLSEYDSQCSILNRRGFIERAIRLNRENVGKHAVCVFMDLDHLKEINDTFGHSQGDVALTALSDIIKQSVRNNDLVARIGGDEFVGMFIIDTPEYDQLFRTRIRRAFDAYNEISGLPYYVEASVGIAHFTCNQGLEISKIVNDADRYLYEAKRSKRPCAIKPPAP